jgi:hypothetical protein
MARRTIALVVDALIVVVSASVLWIALIGGAVVTLGSVRIGLRSVDNPILILAGLSIIRYGIRTWGPFLGLARWDLADIDRVPIRLLLDVRRWTTTARPVTIKTILLCAFVAVVAVKGYNAWRSPGFFSGDDLEVQEMSLSALGRLSWPIWDLRSPIFPLAIVFPAQAAAHAAGLADRELLVFVGRLPVVILSTLALILVFKIIEREHGPGWALAGAAFLAVNKLQMAFGSSELPRPVSTVLVLTAYAIVSSGSTPLRSALAGAILGLGATFRFSEAVFLVPAVLSLIFRRELKSALVLAVTAICAIAGLLAVTDHFYWGQAFHSVRSALDYTIVHRLSSRGYQHPLWYLTALPQWINPVVFAVALLAVSNRTRDAALWALAPLCLLSLLPHKEARYAIPVVPFVCILAVAALKDIADRAAVGRHPSKRIPVALVAVLFCLGAAQDVAHWRLPRTDADVRFAQALPAVIPAGDAVAIEQAWRMGGRVYLDRYRFSDLDPSLLDDSEYFQRAASASPWLIVDSRTVARGPVRDGLEARRYRLVLQSESSRFTVWMPSPAQ